MKYLRNLVLSLVIILVITQVLPVQQPASTHAQSAPIRVSSKNFTESYILAYLVMIPLEEAGYQVEDMTDFGDTNANREALLGNQVDVYVEYTGTALTNFFPSTTFDDVTFRDAYFTYASVSSLDASMNDIIWLHPAPGNNTFAIVVTRDFADEHGLATMEDFAAYVNDGGEIYMAASEDFLFRPDALPAFESAYNFDVDGTQMFVINQAFPTLTEQALVDGVNGINASFAFSTDALIQHYDLVLLEDTLGSQPVFQPTPIFRGNVIRENPEITRILNPIFKTLDSETLQTLNKQVDVDGLSPREVAQRYLDDNGLLVDEETPIDASAESSENSDS